MLLNIDTAAAVGAVDGHLTADRSRNGSSRTEQKNEPKVHRLKVQHVLRPRQLAMALVATTH